MEVQASLEQAWPPFVLVAGLLLVGRFAAEEGVFAWGAGTLDRLGGGPSRLFAASCALVCVVTALLNLDTAVVFLTPVLVLAARRRGADERPFLYASVLLANASSLFLPGSNLTNLIVLAEEPVSGATFAARLLAPACAAVLVTAGGLWALERRRLRVAHPALSSERVAPPRLRAFVVVAVVVAAVVGLRNPALPVLALGLLVVAPRLGPALRALGLPTLAGLFALSVALGVLAREVTWPAQLLDDAGRWGTAGIGAVASVAVNNLPAAVMLSAQPIAHPRALLFGLDLGPNLAVTGSLSAVLWWRAARSVDAEPSALGLSRRGIVLAPLAIVAALAIS